MYLKTLRVEKGYNQEEIAKHIGISTATYSNYETGKRKIPAEHKQKIAEFLGIDNEEDIFLPSSYAIRGN